MAADLVGTLPFRLRRQFGGLSNTDGIRTRRPLYEVPVCALVTPDIPALVGYELVVDFTDSAASRTLYLHGSTPFENQAGRSLRNLS